MNRISTREKATVCVRNTCVIVYGEAARFISCIAVIAAVAIALVLLAKALR
jgi:hypothetical protein